MKPMKYRDLAGRLLVLGCTPRLGRGDHEVWRCPCGEHTTSITRTREVSPGLIRTAVKRLACLPEGWLE